MAYFCADVPLRTYSLSLASKKYLRRIQIIFMFLVSAFRWLFWGKFSFRLVPFSKSYARKEKWLFFSEHSIYCCSLVQP